MRTRLGIALVALVVGSGAGVARGQEEPTAAPAGGPEDAAADAPAADGADGEAIPVEGKAAAPAPGGVPRGPAPRGPAIKLDPAPAH